MGEMTEAEWENLYENFDTTWLLSAVDHVDKLRGHLADDGLKPPDIRIDLLRLHQLAMAVVNNRQTGKAQKFFDLAYELESQVFDMLESLEYVYEKLGELTELSPDSLAFDDYEAEDFDIS